MIVTVNIQIASITWNIKVQKKPDDNSLLLKLYFKLFRFVEVVVDPETLQILEGKEKLENWFQRGKLDLRKLIEDGVMYKVQLTT